METAISAEQDLIQRYHQLLLTGTPTIYYKDKQSWEKEIRDKIKELNQIVKKHENINTKRNIGA